MKTTTVATRRHDSFAVIRDYQPTRIERELLAQVFDLAQRGLTSGSTRPGAATTTVGTTRGSVVTESGRVPMWGEPAMELHNHASEAIA
jgi:hypothetical protein